MNEQVRTECNKVLSLSLFNTSFTKSVVVEEYEQTQGQTLATTVSSLKDTWSSSLKSNVKASLKEVRSTRSRTYPDTCLLHACALFTSALSSHLRSLHTLALFTPSLFKCIRSLHTFALSSFEPVSHPQTHSHPRLRWVRGGSI